MVNNPFKQESIENLQSKLGHHFGDVRLLYSALTHTSWLYEQRSAPWPHQERLEFLGDAVLEFVVSEELYRHAGNLPEGMMTRLRQLIVREETLAQVGDSLGAGECLLLGKGEEQTAGRFKSSNLEDTTEALFAAVYLDAGMEMAREVILKHLNPLIKKAMSGKLIFDYKSRLLERIQEKDKTPDVRFVVVKEEGPAHQRIFTINLVYHSEILATAQGTTKKQAEQEASRIALLKLS